MAYPFFLDYAFNPTFSVARPSLYHLQTSVLIPLSTQNHLLQSYLQQRYLGTISQIKQQNSQLIYSNFPLLNSLLSLSLYDYKKSPDCQQTTFSKGNEEFTVKTELSSYYSGTISPQINTTPKIKETKKDPVDFIELQIERMIDYLVQELGNATKEEVEEQRAQYSTQSFLLGLFDKLVAKYNHASKCKEEMTRHVMRKALKFKRDVIKNERKITAKAANVILCQRYFNTGEITPQNEKAMLSYLLPYKEGSRNRTPNSQFISEIFASAEFYQDFYEYFENFDEIFESENQRKKKKLIVFLKGCVENNTMEEIKEFKRLPWTNAWVKASKNIANQLLNKYKKQEWANFTSRDNSLVKKQLKIE